MSVISLIQMIWTFLMNIMANSMIKLFIMNMKDHYVQIVKIQWIVMVLKHPNKINGKEHVKNNIVVQFVEKLIIQI